MRRIWSDDQPRAERNWPDPPDVEYVRAAAALMGFTLLMSRKNQWLIETDRRGSWWLYASYEEIQGPDIPETNDEWVAALKHLYDHRNSGRNWLTGHTKGDN